MENFLLSGLVPVRATLDKKVEDFSRGTLGGFVVGLSGLSVLDVVVLG